MIPADHLGLLLHQCHVFQIKIELYFCATETEIMYMLRIQSFLLIAAHAYMTMRINACVNWAQTEHVTVPRFFTPY